MPQLEQLVANLDGADLAHVVERLDPAAGAALFALAGRREAAKALEEMNVAAQRAVVSHTVREGLGLAREASTGLLLGAACGLIVAGLTVVWQRSPLLGLIVGAAMLCGLTVAALLGVVVPVILDRFGLDPAVGSSPLITTAADVTALLIYFVLATRWLERLGWPGPGSFAGKVLGAQYSGSEPSQKAA
jgi:Mg/Co/Ni transporter MgtE